MSRKRTSNSENLQWLERRDRQREEAARKAEEQRQSRLTPGYRRLVLEED